MLTLNPKEVVKYLRGQNMLAFQCVNSRGMDGVDIIAIPPLDNPFFESIVHLGEKSWETLLIACEEKGIVDKKKRENLIEAAMKYGCIPVLASKIRNELQFRLPPPERSDTLP